ncbi:MAG: phosphatase PAP2 family protein [Saprospiraceae bacterium]|nr:phosphatase PAP2 family protein [Saprospiraceae bacterium]
MKTPIKLLFLAGLLALAVSSCKKEPLPSPEYDAYTWSSTDMNAGTWKPILLASPDQFPVAAPADPTSAEFLGELEAVKTMSANPTGSQQDAIARWSTNGFIRWNEIARELVAKYFIFPRANADGNYTLPSPAKPDVYPFFPMATPPYAVRAYSYLSAGTFDALIAAWHYKGLYQRQAPSTYDASITTHLPNQAVPAYPSEDAVIAAFSATILGAMFPNEKAYINELAEEHKNSRLWAGMNVASDLTAGDALGREIATIFLARAKTDKMGAALGNAADWDSITVAQTAKGQPIWESLEIPARAMLAPNYGHVVPWTFSPAEVTTTFRLQAPPAVGTPAFQEQLDEVLHFSKGASTKEQQIAFRWDDGTSTYTPPGHWNWIAEPYVQQAHLNPLRSARVFTYLNMAMMDAGICTWDNKYFYFFPRPTNINPDIKTILPVPNFPSYPSGHSTFSAAAATVLGHFFPERNAFFEGEAREAALSRLYGCIHYRFDCEDGITLGNAIGLRSVQIAQADGAE